MEIDEINLQDELTSEFLSKYLSGEISFHEWLSKLQSGGHGEENVLADEVVPNADDINMVEAGTKIHKKVGEDDNHGVFCICSLFCCPMYGSCALFTDYYPLPREMRIASL